MSQNLNGNKISIIPPELDPFEMDAEYDVIMKDLDEEKINLENPVKKGSKINYEPCKPEPNNKQFQISSTCNSPKQSSSTKPVRRCSLSLALWKPQAKWNSFKREKLNLNPGSTARKMNLYKQTTLELKEISDQNAKKSVTISGSLKSLKNSSFKIDNDTWRLLEKALNWQNQNADKPDCINLKWIKENASSIPPNSKIPILLASVKTELHNGKSFLLADKSTSISASVDDAILENYRGILLPGSCFAIKNCLFRRTEEDVILTIKNPNVICIASKADFKNSDIRLPTFSDFVFFRKKDKAGVALLQFENINYIELRNAERALLDKLTTLKCRTKHKSEDIFSNRTFTCDQDESLTVFDDDEDEFLKAIADQVG